MGIFAAIHVPEKFGSPHAFIGDFSETLNHYTDLNPNGFIVAGPRGVTVNGCRANSDLAGSPERSLV
jgi:hypothetical protein